jgi:hypothetical protein
MLMTSTRYYLAAILVGGLAIGFAVANRTADVPTPQAGSNTSTAMPITTTPDPPIACGRLHTEYENGFPITEGFLNHARAVHAAACAGDTDTLLRDVDPGQREELASLFTFRQFRADFIAVLESAPLAGYNSLVYCVPGKGIIGFARETSANADVWSYGPYVLEC